MKKGLLFLVLIGEVFFLGSYQTAWAVDFSEERNGAWETFKQITIEGYKNYPAYGLVFDSASCTPDSNAACDYAVSEGQGYGLLLAAIQKNQKSAQEIIASIYETMTLNNYLCPGNYTCTPDELNFSYFAPAWYKVFAVYDPAHDWRGVIDKQYDLLLAVAKKFNGLIPDWCTENGDVTYNNRPHNMTYDAIRVPWRLALDSIWNNDPRAQEYLNLVMPYVLAKSGAKDIKMYSIPEGNPLEWHNELTVALWSAGAWGSNLPADQKNALVQEFRSFYNPVDQSFNATWAPAKWYYFNQALSLLAAATIDGSLFNPLPFLDAQDNTKSKLFRKKGKIDRQRILVQVRQKGENYTLAFFKRGKSAKNAVYRKSAHPFYQVNYIHATTLQKIIIKNHRVILKHKSGFKKIFKLFLKWQAKDIF